MLSCFEAIDLHILGERLHLRDSWVHAGLVRSSFDLEFAASQLHVGLAGSSFCLGSAASEIHIKRKKAKIGAGPCGWMQSQIPDLDRRL